MHGEEIDLDKEIPDDEDPLNDAHEKGHMYQGDIDLTDEQLALLTGNETARLEMRQVILRNHWPRVGNRITIPYTTSVNFEESERANIARAFEEYEKHTCFRYRKFNNECLIVKLRVK